MPRFLPAVRPSHAALGLTLALAASGAASARQTFNPRIVSPDFGRASAVTLANIDNGATLDAVAMSVFPVNKISWFANGGGPNPEFTEHIVASGLFGGGEVAVADLNNDTRADIIATLPSAGQVVWFENNGGSPPTFTQRTIASGLVGVFALAVGDLNQDNFIDVVAARPSNGLVLRFANSGVTDGALPPSFTQHTVADNADGCRGVFVVDINGDTHRDVICYSDSTNTLFWMQNPGTLDSVDPFTQRIVGGAPTGFGRVWAANLNNDTNPDVLLVTATGMRWFRNQGGSNPTFQQNLLTFEQATPADVTAANIDNADGIDPIACFSGGRGVSWFENDGLTMPGFPERFIEAGAFQFIAVRAGDIDGDGDIDVLAGASDPATSALFWFENGPLDFAMERQTIDGGGGISAGLVSPGPPDGVPEQLVLAATIGQPDASGAFGAGFEVRGGFWMAPSLAPCPGDTNGDRVVDFNDLNNILATFGQTGPGILGDLDGDGDVDFTDLNILLANFGADCTGGGPKA